MNRGSILCYLCEIGMFGQWERGRYPFVLQNRLNAAFRAFGHWKSTNKVSTTQARFTCSRLGRHSRQDFPSLQSKGVAGKRISFWLAEMAQQNAQQAEASEFDQLVATTAMSYRRFLELCDASPLVLTQDQANAIFRAGHIHLLSYAQLRKKSMSITGNTPGRCVFQLAPKSHYFLHALLNVRQTRVNCRYYTLLTAEGFVGVIARIARACHRSTVSKRVLQRYKVKLRMELRCHRGKGFSDTMVGVSWRGVDVFGASGFES